jgi:membrane-associated phospholipid phosphatase
MTAVSAVLHPMLMASYMSAILALFMPEAYFPYPPEATWRLVLAFFILTAGFPAVLVIGLYLFTPLVTDLELSNRKERYLPFFILIFSYAIAARFLVIELELGVIVRILLLSSTLLIVILLAINTKFKISIHGSAMWSLTGYCTGLSIKYGIPEMLPMVYIGIIGGGLVATSRLYLGYHRPVEIWSGSILGFLYSIAVIYIFL